MNLICIKKKDYEIIKNLTVDSRAERFLVVYKNKPCVVIRYFLESEMVVDLKKFKRLQRTFYYAPKVVSKSIKDKVILREYIEGPTALELLSQTELEEDIYKQIYEIYRFCRIGKFEIDYLPSKFVYKGTHLYYIGEYIGLQDKNKNFENYGVFYWVYSTTLVKYLEEKGLPVDKSRILTNAEANKKIVLLSIANW